MKVNFSFILAIFLTLPFIQSCSVSKNYPPPPIAATINISDEPYQIDEVIKQTSRIENSEVFFYQGNGGSIGLAILGALSGGLGAGLAAEINSELVAAKTDAMTSEMAPPKQINLINKIKQEITKKTSVSLSGNADFIVSGALLISAHADDNVRTRLIINAKDTSIPKGWNKSYFYHFQNVISFESFQQDGVISHLNKFLPDLSEAIDVTTTVLVKDLQGKLAPGKDVLIQSDYLRPLGDTLFHFGAEELSKLNEYSIYRIDGEPGLVLFPTVDGIHLFKHGQFSIVPPK
jgi:hypothetical protein